MRAGQAGGGMMDESMVHVRALYDAHGGALLRYLKALTGRTEMAEDLLQETFVQAMKGLHQLRKVRSPRAWLFAIARHLGLNAVQRRRATVPLWEGMAATPSNQEDPRYGQVRKAITELPNPQREAMTLRLTQGLSYEEIAEVLGVPVGTVRSRLHNAVRNLRDRLNPGED